MTSTEPRTTNDLPARVLETAKRHHLEGYLLSARLIVGVSGGTDSLALLHILRELRGEGAPNSIHVAHLDHGLRGDQGRQDAEFVRRTAEKWGLPCTARSFDVKSFALDLKLSVEEAARKVRYAFLAELARQRTATVAVAHNADDQAETVLMNMLRGTGVTGLAGMRMLAPVPVVPEAMEDEDHGVVVRHEESSIMVFRPLLDTWRWEIEDYCDQVGLVPREDATNTSPAYERNRVRHELIPRLERYYSPAVKEHLVNLAAIASEEDQFITQIAAEEAARIAQVDTTKGVISFSQVDVASQPLAMRRRLVRWALRLLSGSLEGLTFRQIEDAGRILAGEVGSPSAMDLPHGLMVGRTDERSTIRVRSSKTDGPSAGEQGVGLWPVMDPEREYSLALGDGVQLQAGWALTSKMAAVRKDGAEPGELLALFDMESLQHLGPLTLRTRREGDWLQPLGMKGRKTLQDLYVDAKIPRWVRDHLPVVAVSEGGGEVLWVPGPGGRRSARAPVTEQTTRTAELQFTRSEDVSYGTSTG